MGEAAPMRMPMPIPMRMLSPVPGATARGVSVGHVLLVDDDDTVADVLVRYLVSAGLTVTRVADGVAALAAAERRWPDLVLLDVMLPGLDGLGVCRWLRQRGEVPIIMVSARGHEEERVLGLELGADDYVTKPFSPRELLLRVQSLLRRSNAGRAAPGSGSGRLCDDTLVVDRGARAASLDGAVMALTGREFDLLVHFLSFPGQAFTRAELLEQVWDWSFGDESTVTVHVRRLRNKVERDPAAPCRLVTIWGVGYRWDSS